MKPADIHKPPALTADQACRAFLLEHHVLVQRAGKPSIVVDVQTTADPTRALHVAARMFPEATDISIAPPEVAAPQPPSAFLLAAKARREANKRPCLCGCGEVTGGGFFRPGHDSKMVKRIMGEQKLDYKTAVERVHAAKRIAEKGKSDAE